LRSGFSVLSVVFRSPCWSFLSLSFHSEFIHFIRRLFFGLFAVLMWHGRFLDAAGEYSGAPECPTLVMFLKRRYAKPLVACE
jgi:hypothetical protein